MAKREFSSGLKAMKFMQRAKAIEEQAAKEEQTEMAVDEDHWVMPIAQTSGRCAVISEGDPRPGANIGRMSFKSYNPAIENLHEQIQARRERARNAAKSTNSEDKPATTGEGNKEENGKLSIASNHSINGRIVIKHEEQPGRKKAKIETTTTVNTAKNSKTPSVYSSKRSAKPANKYDALQSARGFRKPRAL